MSVTPGEGLPASWEAVWREDLLGGVVVIEGPGFGCVPTERPLYAAVAQGYKTGQVPAHITAIPYYAWANRGPAAMRVWLIKK